jgi:hypothetical protein
MAASTLACRQAEDRLLEHHRAHVELRLLLAEAVLDAQALRRRLGRQAEVGELRGRDAEHGAVLQQVLVRGQQCRAGAALERLFDVQHVAHDAIGIACEHGFR